MWKGRRLKISDLYSSEDEEDVLPSNVVEIKEEYSFEELVRGLFVVVTFLTGPKLQTPKDYVGIIQNVDSLDEREVEVMFLKRSTKDNSIFFPNEDDQSYISVDQIRGILPTPVIMPGNRLYYKFQGPIYLR